MTDLSIAKLFFKMLKKRGFGIEIRDYSDRVESDPEFDWTQVSFNLLDSRNQTFMCVDFLSGNFYRISGRDSTGWYGDEVDLRKYT